MKLETLYSIAERQSVQIHNYPFKKIISMSTNGNIGIDFKKIKNSREHKTVVAHELGHCSTGSFYNTKSKFETIGRMEYRADKWATSHIIPFDEYYRALTAGITEIWQLAEYFEVTEEFMKKSAQLYEGKVLELYAQK